MTRYFLVWTWMSCWLWDSCSGWNNKILHPIRSFPQIVHSRGAGTTCSSRDCCYHVSRRRIGRLFAAHHHHVETDHNFNNRVKELFSKGSIATQSEIDEFFRNKPTLTLNHVGTILDGSVSMRKKRRLDVLKKQHLVHITSELRRLRQGKEKPNAFQIAALVHCLQTAKVDDAQTSGTYR